MPKAVERAQLFTRAPRTKFSVIGMTVLNSLGSPQHILDVLNCSSAFWWVGPKSPNPSPGLALDCVDWRGCVSV